MGKPGVRLTDMTAHGGTIVGPGVPTVMTGKMPAATILDQHVCPMVTGVVPHVGGPSTLGSTGVFIGKKPAGRVGDLHVCVGPPSMPVMGCFTVLIGEVGGAGGGASAGAAASAASAKTKGPASVEPFPLSDPPAAPENHYSHFRFTDSAGKGLGGIPYTYTGPDKAEKRGSSAPEGDVYYSGLPKGGSFQVKAGAVSDAKWSKAKANVDEEVEMTAKADGLKDGTEAIITVLERSNTGRQRFLHHVDCKVSGKQIKAKWKADPGSDDPDLPPADPAKRESFTYQFIAYAAGGVAVSDKLELNADLEIEILDEIEQPVADKPVEVLLANGEVKTGKLDAKGKLKLTKLPAKPAQVTLKVPGVYRGSLPGVSFETGKSLPTVAALNGLFNLNEFYKAHPDLKILIVGHTDRVGKDAENLELSKDRADAIAAVMKKDMAAWLKYYDSTKPKAIRWGFLEDKIMLSSLSGPPDPSGTCHSYLNGPIDGRADASYDQAMKTFQREAYAAGNHSLPTEGQPSDSTRLAIIERYMELANMAMSYKLDIQTHGCGEFHNLKPTGDGVPEPRNRRVEIYMFEDAIVPAPSATCPGPHGCAQWDKWTKQTTNLIDLKVSNLHGIKRSEFTQSLLDCFADIDADKDGVLSLQELKKATTNKRINGQRAAAMAALYAMTEAPKYSQIFNELSDDEKKIADRGITLADIDALDRLRHFHPKNKLLKFFNVRFDCAKRKISDPSRFVYIGSIDPDLVDQGMIGDCWFLSALVGLATVNDQKIKSMIQAMGNGTFIVSMPGLKSGVTIDAPTDAEIGLFSSSNGNGIWPTILEKAYGQYNNTNPTSNRTSGAADGADGGDHINKGIEILTGNKADRVKKYPHWGQDIRNRLEQTLAGKKIVVAASLPRMKEEEDYTPDKIVRSHAYSILYYDRKADEIILRNPWGYTEFTKKQNVAFGFFKMSFSEFNANFSEIAFET